MANRNTDYDQVGFAGFYLGDEGELPSMRTDVVIGLNVAATLADLERYVRAGEVSGPIVQQPQNAPRQADRRLEADRPEAAAAALERGLARLDQPKCGDHLTEEARSNLIAQLEGLIRQNSWTVGSRDVLRPGSRRPLHHVGTLHRVERFFRAVRAGDLEQVRQLLDARPELADAVRKPPPKKDAGQGPLGIAIKTGYTDIARLLIERGADVNFIEDHSVPGRMPVIADAIESALVAVVAKPRPGRREETLDLLRHLIACGARTDLGVDEGVTPTLFRAVRSTLAWRRDPLSDDERAGVAAVFRVLVDAGARLDVTIAMGEQRVGLREYLTRRVPVAYPAVPAALLAILEELAPPGSGLPR